jgi:hypothetical protein
MLFSHNNLRRYTAIVPPSAPKVKKNHNFIIIKQLEAPKNKFRGFGLLGGLLGSIGALGYGCCITRMNKGDLEIIF